MEDLLVIAGSFTYIIGLLAIVIGSIWFYVEAFREGIGWGMACLFFPPATLAFLFMKPERSLWPTGVIFLGVFMVVMASLMV
jgi:hypothetical protein